MKKTILTVFAAAALAACSTPDIPVSDQNAISFGRVGTRAGLSDLQTNGFGVWATITNDQQNGFTIMNNVEVKYDADQAVWDYNPKVYWVPDTEHKFMAVYPYDNTTTSIYTYADGDVSFALFDYPYEDYLVATNITDTSDDGYNTTVQLNFQHVLTSVGINIWRDEAKHTNDQMRIKQAVLGNIRKEGTYSVANEEWSYFANSAKLTASWTNNNLAETDNIGAAMFQENGSLQTGGNPSSPFGTMMLLPQTLDASNRVSLKIVYELKRNNAADWEEITLETALPDITWENGRRYTYNVVLSSVTDITIYYIQTKVDQWGTPQVGATVIIK